MFYVDAVTVPTGASLSGLVVIGSANLTVALSDGPGVPGRPGSLVTSARGASLAPGAASPAPALAADVVGAAVVWSSSSSSSSS